MIRRKVEIKRGEVEMRVREGGNEEEISRR